MIILFFYQSRWGICATIPCGSGRRGRRPLRSELLLLIPDRRNAEGGVPYSSFPLQLQTARAHGMRPYILISEL